MVRLHASCSLPAAAGHTPRHQPARSCHLQHCPGCSLQHLEVRFPQGPLQDLTCSVLMPCRYTPVGLHPTSRRWWGGLTYAVGAVLYNIGKWQGQLAL